MITSEQLNYHALEFFKKYKGKSNLKTNFESDALSYVKKQNDFRYKDKVNGDTLVMILENLDFLEYIKDTKRLHIITSKGLDFLNEN
jgi:hypothetical protein